MKIVFVAFCLPRCFVTYIITRQSYGGRKGQIRLTSATQVSGIGELIGGCTVN